MIIPIRDDNPTSSRPVVTWALIALNVMVFAVEWLSGPYLDPIIRTFGVVPAELLGNPVGEAYTVVSSMFLHGGVMHLLGNMWFLYIFGDNVEDRLGKLRFVAFYLASGVGAALLQVLLTPQSMIPTIGASGAIAGVLGAYALVFPHAKVVSVTPLFWVIPFIRLPAFVFLGVWFGIQFLSGLGSIGQTGGGTAWWAHIGGFLVGGAVGLWLRSRSPTRRVRTETPRPRLIRTEGQHPGVIIRLDDRRRRPTYH